MFQFGQNSIKTTKKLNGTAKMDSPTKKPLFEEPKLPSKTETKNRAASPTFDQPKTNSAESAASNPFARQDKLAHSPPGAKEKRKFVIQEDSDDLQPLRNQNRGAVKKEKMNNQKVVKKEPNRGSKS